MTLTNTEIPVTVTCPPPEGPRVVPLSFDFTTATSYPVDLEILRTTGRMSSVQTVYLDNSGGTQSLTVTVQSTGQVISCRAGWQGYFPILMASALRFTVACAGGTAATSLYLVNVVLPVGVWQA